MTDEAGRVRTLPSGEVISVESANEWAVMGLIASPCIRVRLDGKDFDAVNVELPVEERKGG